METKNKKSRKSLPGYTLVPKGEYYQARKIGITSERVKTDPVYHLARLRAKEFSQAAKLGKLIRSALLTGTGIKNTSAPLTAALLKALNANEETIPGQRDFSTAKFDSLIGFNCNENASLQQCLAIDFNISVRDFMNIVDVRAPSFSPAQVITAPEGVTHCRIFTTTAVIDMEQRTFEKEELRTTIIPLKNITIDEKLWMTVYSPNHLVLVAAGITWYQPHTKTGKLVVSKIPGPLAIIHAFEKRCTYEGF